MYNLKNEIPIPPFLLTSSEIKMKLRKKNIPNYVSKLAYAICAMFTISALSSSGGQTLEISQWGFMKSHKIFCKSGIPRHKFFKLPMSSSAL